jgi:hypothetical protein
MIQNQSEKDGINESPAWRRALSDADLEVGSPANETME